MKPHDPSCERHHCHASGCGAHVPPEMLMCRRHWFMVPMDIRGRVWATYQSGQERLDDTSPLPSSEWHVAADQAICAVAHKEFPRLAPPHKCVRGAV